MTIDLQMPRYVRPKILAGGVTGFYWSCPGVYAKAGFPTKAKSLGTNLSQVELNAAAASINAMLDEWRHHRNTDQPLKPISEYGTIAWLFRTYMREDCFLQRVDVPNRPDYERIYTRLAGMPLKSGKTFGETPVSAVSVKMATNAYKKLTDTGAMRSAEKALMYARTAWARMIPLYPAVFNERENPWDGVTKHRREKLVKGAVTREDVYAFAEGALRLGRPQCAAAAVICFEWLMRPRNVSAGFLTWSDYRGASDPTGIRIRHKKNNQTRIHPLEFIDDDEEPVLLYAEAESILSRVPKIGLSIVCNPEGKPYGEMTSRLPQIVRETADKLKMPSFTLDACRHGGMTELEEAGLTDGQGRALSAHKTNSAYAGYAKKTAERMMKATLRRRESRLQILRDDGEGVAARTGLKIVKG